MGHADVERDFRRALNQMAFRGDKGVPDCIGQLRIVNGVQNVVRFGSLAGDLHLRIDAQGLRGVPLLRQIADYAFDLKSVQFQDHEGMIL